MLGFSRVIAVPLVAIVAATVLSGQVVHMAQPAHPGPAPCHGHSSALPSPQPVNDQCCRTGHASALLQSSIFPCPTWTTLYHGSELASASSLPILYYALPILSAPSSSPPRTVSLRI
jgi:hypothetical protein